MSAVRMWRHPNQWLWMSYRFDDGWTEHIALPLAEHEELVGLLGEARAALRAADEMDARSMYERDVDCDFHKECSATKRCKSVERMGGGPVSARVRPTLARLDRALARLGKGGG